jgi:hypothetical protein
MIDEFGWSAGPSSAIAAILKAAWAAPVALGPHQAHGASRLAGWRP